MEKHETTTSEVTENKNKEMSGQESYDLIKTMIRKTQNSGGAHCGDTFLVFGYLSLFLGFFIYYTVSTTGNANWTLAWWAEIFIGIPLSCWLKRRHPREAKTYTGETIGKMWLISSLFMIIAAISITFSKLDGIFIMPVIMMIASIATTATLFIMNEKYWMFIFPAIVFWLGIDFLIQDVSHNVALAQLWQFGLAFFLMMGIPGHILNYKYGKKK